MSSDKAWFILANAVRTCEPVPPAPIKFTGQVLLSYFCNNFYLFSIHSKFQQCQNVILRYPHKKYKYLTAYCFGTFPKHLSQIFGTNWKAETQKFEKDDLERLQSNMQSNIYISCVDSVKSRFYIAEILNELKIDKSYYRNQCKYWIDFGNSQFTGQVLLSTIGNIKQPNSEKYETVESLPFITEEFGELLKISEAEDDTPSCSLAEALEKQDLFINSTLAQMGSSLLWSLFRNGLIENRGFFLNLINFQSQPIKL